MKKMFARLFLGLGFSMFSLAAVGGISVFAQNGTAPKLDVADGFNTSTAENSGLSGVSDKRANLLDVIKTFINWVLGLLSLIALAVCLWGGFQMVTAAGDEKKYKGGFEILKQAAIGLVVVGLSWIIVSTIFWFIGAMSGSGSGTGS